MTAQRPDCEEAAQRRNPEPDPEQDPTFDGAQDAELALARRAIDAAGGGPSPDQTAFERRPGARRDLLLLCDHASNARPADLGDLGLPAEDLARHIAYDLGARGVTLGLAALLDAPALLASFSRLVIDPNRGEDDPTLIMRLYDRSIIPANARADAAERDRRLGLYHRPYRQAVEAELRAMTAAAGRPPLLIALHSFAPSLRGRPRRPWHIGVLWDDDPKTASRLLDQLRGSPDLVVGDNEPYSGSLPGDMMWTHGRGRPHVLIELRNDLIEGRAAQAAWAARLAPILGALAQEVSAR